LPLWQLLELLQWHFLQQRMQLHAMRLVEPLEPASLYPAASTTNHILTMPSLPAVLGGQSHKKLK
jgi:hypothetical protein